MKIDREIEKPFPILEKIFSEKEPLEFKNVSISNLCNYHFGLGTQIRNNLLCSSDWVIYDLFLENGITHKDDMSSIIIYLFHYYISKSACNAVKRLYFAVVH